MYSTESTESPDCNTCKIKHSVQINKEKTYDYFCFEMQKILNKVIAFTTHATVVMQCSIT